MTHISLTPFKFEVEPLYAQLRLHPEVWNEIPYRTNFAGSPHREVDDIWIRYNALSNYSGDGAAFNSEHQSVWYPVASVLSQAKILSIELAQMVDATSMGGVLITRVPAKGKVYPHVDNGWHARYYDKFIIQIRGNSQQAFCFEGESLSANTGDCYWFDNAFTHWVTNDSDEERISLIVCVRRQECH